MKSISELILELEEIKESVGNIDVFDLDIGELIIQLHVIDGVTILCLG